MDLAEVVPSFDALGVCWGPYQPLEKALDDPRLYAGKPEILAAMKEAGL